MRINLRKCREKSFIPVLVLLCFLISGVVIKSRMKRNYNTPGNKVTEASDLRLPTLVMACYDRTLKRTMETVVRFRPNAKMFPIIIALYCFNNDTIEVIKSFTSWDRTVTMLTVPPPNQTHDRNYKFALNHVFGKLNYEAAIVLEDYLDISPDFFEYFLSTYRLLSKDPSIWCVSAWNDNCKKGLVDENQNYLLHRTDFFPGKGWMLLSKTWKEIEPTLPEDFVLYHLHNPDIIRGRVCIRPEISRTYLFRKYRSSNDAYVSIRILNTGYVPITILNTEYVPFTVLNLSYLLKQEEHSFIHFVYSRPETTLKNVLSGNLNSSLKYVQIPYQTTSMFKRAAKELGLMDHFIHGVPPTALHGIVQCYINGHRIYFTPSKNLSTLFIDRVFGRPLV